MECFRESWQNIISRTTSGSVVQVDEMDLSDDFEQDCHSFFCWRDNVVHANEIELSASKYNREGFLVGATAQWKLMNWT